MRQIALAILCASVCATSALAQVAKISALVTDGGPVVTDLGYNVKVNDGSTLRRSWVTLNDTASAVQLAAAGVATTYGNREYQFTPTGKAKATTAATAFEVRYLLFDTFGNHLKTLSGTEIRDLISGGELELAKTGTWRAFENEVSQLLTVVSFVAFTRTADGKVWRYNEKAIGAELARIELQVKSGILEPTKQQ